jgi:LemA protein
MPHRVRRSHMPPPFQRYFRYIFDHSTTAWTDGRTVVDMKPYPVHRWAGMLLAAVAGRVLLSGCGYNEFQTKDEATKAAWGEVVNQYQRRADLIPNLVNTVKGYASHERKRWKPSPSARAAATSFQITPEVLNNPEAFQKFQQVQGELSGALSRLMAVSENYPHLKADTSFRDLQSQLEGTENRITVARQRYIAAVQDYNVLARSFPTNLTAMMFGYQVKPSFTVENEKADLDRAEGRLRQVSVNAMNPLLRLLCRPRAILSRWVRPSALPRSVLCRAEAPRNSSAPTTVPPSCR